MTDNPRAKKRALARNVRRVVYAIVGVAVVALLAWTQRPRPTAVQAGAVARGPMTVTVDEDGVTRVKDRYLVSAPLAGNLGRIELSPGDAVKRGAILTRMLPVESPLLDARSKAGVEARVLSASAAQRQARTAIDRAKTALELAQSEADRTKALSDKGALPPAELERASLLLKSRREELASAQFGAAVADHEVEVAAAAVKRVQPGTKSEQFEVTSPCDGVVLRVLQKDGVVQAGTPLLEIGDPAALEVVVDVLTADAIQLRAGAKVRLDRWGGDEPLAAHVKLVEPSAFVKLSSMGVEESRVNAVVQLDDPRDKWKALGDGYRLEARIVVWQADDVITVPEGALFRRNDGWATFVIEGDKAALRPVKVGRRNGTVAQVLDGLRAGERVILHPSDTIAVGSRVESR